MSKTAKVKRFKLAFLKPTQPDKESLKAKTEMEKAVALAKKSDEGDRDKGEKQLVNQSAGLKMKGDNQKEYLKELLAYKMTKHWDEPEDFKVWLDFCGDHEDKLEAAKKVLGANPSDDFVEEMWDRCKGKRVVTELCYELAPDKLVDSAYAEFEKTGDCPELSADALSSRVAKKIGTEKGIDKIPLNLRNNILLDDAAELARLDAKGFAKTFVKEVGASHKLKFMKSPEIRKALAGDKPLWTELCKSMPALKFLDAVQTKVKDVAPKELNKKTAEAVFEELLSDTGALAMSYYTNKLNAPTDILATPREDSIDVIKSQRERLRQDILDEEKEMKPGYEKSVESMKSTIATMPDIPGAQCDELVTVLMNVVEAALGPKSGVACKHIVLPGMVLTVPISGLPGGLLKKTFGGNVYNDAKKLTGQVLFTGNDMGDEPNAHTVLEVGGVKYDAVLGTKGKAVDDAVAEQFDVWNKTGWKSKADATKLVWVAKSKTTANWIVKEEGLKAAANQNGFSTAYRLTTDISKYVDKA